MYNTPRESKVRVKVQLSKIMRSWKRSIGLPKFYTGSDVRIVFLYSRKCKISRCILWSIHMLLKL
jgi:hypothetical protein